MRKKTADRLDPELKFPIYIQDLLPLENSTPDVVHLRMQGVPRLIDGLTLCSWAVVRDSLLHWRTRSTGEGYLAVVQDRQRVVDMFQNLNDPNTPAFTLLQALQRQAISQSTQPPQQSSMQLLRCPSARTTSESF